MALQQNETYRRNERETNRIIPHGSCIDREGSSGKQDSSKRAWNLPTSSLNHNSVDERALNPRTRQNVTPLDGFSRDSAGCKDSTPAPDKIAAGDTSETMYSGREDKSPGLALSKVPVPSTAKRSLSNQFKTKVSQTWDRVKQSTGFLKKQAGHKSYKYYSNLL